VVKSKELTEELGISLRQLRKDMDTMKSMDAPLEYVPALYGWRYESGHHFTLMNDLPLTSRDVLLLRVGVEMLAKTGALTDMEEAKEAFGKIHRAVRKWVDPKATAKPIYFDPLPQYDGGRHLAFFLSAIEESRRVEFRYRSFRGDDVGKNVVFDPWFLRHYDRRWYVGGFSHDPSERFVRVFPLERIEGEPSPVGYCHDKPREFDAATYWQHIYGITIPPNAQVENVVIAFSPPQDKYFLNTPFFEPFEVLERSEAGIVVRFSLMVNIDLIRKLASLGDDLRVVEPQHLREALRDFFQRALQQYEE